MPRDVAYIHTDGSCLRNGQQGACGGIGVYWSGREENNVSRPLSEGRQTNQRAEIEAARVGINQAYHLGYRKVTLFTDSKYVIKAIESWIPKWENNNYTNAKGQPVTNTDDFIKLQAAADRVNLRVRYVPREDNEEADELARAGAEQFE